MILEVAILNVVPSQTAEFEKAFTEAKGIISSMPGFISLQLQKCVECSNQYALLVRWEKLDDHTRGFRNSPRYQKWKALLHHFYDPFPTVEHYELIVDVRPAAARNLP